MRDKMYKISEELIRHFGQRNQLLKMIEEMGELQQVIAKMLLYNGKEEDWKGEKLQDIEEKFIEEMADVFVVLDSLVTYKQNQFADAVAQKWERCKKYIKD